jgi:phage head maturation protease
LTHVGLRSDDNFTPRLHGRCPSKSSSPALFDFLNQVITATVLHSDVKVGTTWDRGLRVWQDSCGLGFELDVPITQKGRALRDMIADGGINQTSVGLITLESTDSLDDRVVLRREVTAADIDHIAFVDLPVFEATSYDKRAIFTAASHAQKAADYLHGLQPNADTAPADELQEAA